jgi:Periplasmic binding protein
MNRRKSMIRHGILGALALAAFACPALAQEKVVIGVTAALTGPFAGTTAPPVDGLRIYVDRINAAGGINGKKIDLIIQDDQGQPSRAAVNAKKLLVQDQVQLLVLSSLSSTFAPVVAETKRTNIPLLYMGAVCPKQVYPKAEPLQFCTTAYAGGYDSRATLSFIKETAKQPVRIGFSAMAIPLSRGEIDYAEGEAKKMGMTAVDKEVIPPPTTTRRSPQSSRRLTRTGYSPGRRGSRRSRRSRRSGASAGMATTSLGRTSKPRRNWRGLKTPNSTSSAPIHCSRTICRFTRKSSRR